MGAQKGEVWWQCIRTPLEALAIRKVVLLGPGQLLFAHHQPVLPHVLFLLDEANGVGDTMAQCDRVLGQIGIFAFGRFAIST